jgi:hypothetical protein
MILPECIAFGLGAIIGGGSVYLSTPKKKIEPAPPTVTVEEFESYWLENPDRITVRYHDDNNSRVCTIYKNADPWFDLAKGGGFVEHIRGYAYENKTWTIEALATMNFTGLIGTYLKTTANRIKHQISLQPARDLLIDKAYKEIDDFINKKET